MTLLLRQADVLELVSLEAAIAVTRTTFLDLLRRHVSLPRRAIHPIHRTHHRIDLLPGRVDSLGALGVKLQVVRHRVPRDHKVLRSSGLVALLDPAQVHLEALVDSEAVSMLRSAATSAVAAGLLAQRKAEVLGVLGAGRQAFSQIRGVAQVRKVDRVLVSSLDSGDHMQPFLERIRQACDCEAAWVASDREAVEPADIVILATTSTSPVIRADWLRPGVHVNAVGSDRPTTREVDTASLLKADKVVCDYTPAAVRDSGDLAIPIQSGDYSEARIYADLGELIAGSRLGRQQAEEITLFKSVGLGVQDIGLAAYALEQAREQGKGEEFDFGA